MLAVGCKRPTTIVKQQFHICCLVESAALPVDNEVVATCAVCGLACYPALGLCRTQGTLRRRNAVLQAKGGAPETIEMSR